MSLKEIGAIFLGHQIWPAEINLCLQHSSVSQHLAGAVPGRPYTWPRHASCCLVVPIHLVDRAVARTGRTGGRGAAKRCQRGARTRSR